MWNQSEIVRFLVIVGILAMVLFVYKKYKMWRDDLVVVKSNDQQIHIISNSPDMENSAELLAEIKRRLGKLVIFCSDKYPRKENIQQLKHRFKAANVQETSKNDTGTSYTVNKGDELHMCLRAKGTSELHDINILMFVAIHELAHIMSSSYGHNNEFGQNFRFLLKEAVNCGIYVAEDYNRNTKEFCGIQVTSTPLYQ